MKTTRLRGDGSRRFRPPRLPETTRNRPHGVCPQQGLYLHTLVSPMSPNTCYPCLRTKQGVKVGTEFQVNASTTGGADAPQVAMDANGDFVIAWTTTFTTNPFAPIYAKRFDANGVAQGDQFVVNSPQAPDQGYPLVAMDARGDFVVTWLSSATHNIEARLYNSAGTAQGGLIQVSSVDTMITTAPAVAMDAEGDFTISWSQSLPLQAPTDHSNTLFGGLSDVFARRFDGSGKPEGAVFNVSHGAFQSNSNSRVTMDAAGDTLITWFGTTVIQQGTPGHTAAQAYNAAGAAIGRRSLDAWSGRAIEWPGGDNGRRGRFHHHLDGK